MLRCIDLAKSGKGFVAPNPMVGSVIVYNDKIIGEGWHRKYGTAHAEVNAINSVVDKSLLKESTMYVNLEPCSHFGKTPPCADLIIETQIPHVVIANIDTSPNVSGNGIAKLRNAGIDVITGVMEKEAAELNCRFFTYHEKQRPYIILQWAQTADGFIDKFRLTSEQRPEIISNRLSRTISHKGRTEEAAIFVGTGTVLADNPMLTARFWYGCNPVRLVIDRQGKIPTDFEIFNGDVQTFIFTEHKNKDSGNNFAHIFIDNWNDILEQVLNCLFCQKIQSVIIEGGAKLLQSFIDVGLWDETRIFINNRFLFDGVKAPRLFNAQQISTEQLYDDNLMVFKNCSFSKMNP